MHGWGAVRVGGRTTGAFLVLLLSACANGDSNRVQEAVTAPLHDLNLVRVAIPDVLVAARRQPYAPPEDVRCGELGKQVALLDALLGPDLDAPADARSGDSVDRAQKFAGDEAVGALQRTTEGLVPFRGWVRKLTGAERHSKDVEAAIAAGIARRAFLKGIRFARTCPGYGG